MSTRTRGSAVVTLPTDEQILIVREFAAPAAAESGMEEGMQTSMDALEYVAVTL